MLIALVGAALAGLFVAIPVISLIRSFIIARQVADMRRRLEKLETLIQPQTAGRASDAAGRGVAPVPRTAPAGAPVPQAPPAIASVGAPAASVPASAAVPARPTPPHEDLETVVGGRWLLYAGLVVLLLGFAFFLKYAFDNAWLGRGARCVLGAVSGVALVAGGLRIADRGYSRYGHLAAGAGVVMLYLTSYAALNLYELISRPVATVLLVLITAASAMLADRRGSLGLAVLGVAGGYATPLLVGGGRDAQITLFSYLALLIAGTIYLARRRDWPRLAVLGYALTLVVVALWADTFYTPAKHLRTQLFLTLYCGLFLAALRATARQRYPLEWLALASAPVLYYGLSLALLWDVRVELFVFLILFSGVALAASVAYELDWLRLAAWAAAALPLVAKLERTPPAAVVAALVTAGAVVLMHLAAQLVRLRRESAVRATDIVILHGNGLFAFAASYLVLEDLWLAGSPWIAWALAAGFGLLAWGTRKFNPEAALHWTGLAFGLAAAGVALRFDGPWVIAALASEGAAIVWIALRVGREWFRLAGLAVFALASLLWLQMAADPPSVSFQLVLNPRLATGAFIIALTYALASWHHRGDARSKDFVAPLIVAAQVLTVAALTAEASAYWAVRSLARADASLAAQLSLSLIWAGYAAALVVVGMRRRYPPVRYVAIVLFAVTLLKVFLSDFAALGGVYRVVGFLVVGCVFVLVSFLYQRAR
jgi:uncharacterized membrane protein